MTQSKTSGQRHRELVAKRSREKTRSIQEIAPLPPMVNPKRRMACRKDLRLFCTTYFPKRFDLEFASYHLHYLKRLEDMIIQGGGKVAIAMPRGSGKTTLATTAILWALLYGHCRYIVVVGANNNAADKIIKNIKTSLIQTKVLLEDFPESIYPFKRLGGSAGQARGQRYLGELTGIEWKPNSVVFANIPGSPASGAMLYSVGINGAIRGANLVMPDGSIARPDVVLLDDPQTEAAAKSKKKIENLTEIIDKSVEGLVGPSPRVGDDHDLHGDSRRRPRVGLLTASRVARLAV